MNPPPLPSRAAVALRFHPGPAPTGLAIAFFLVSGLSGALPAAEAPRPAVESFEVAGHRAFVHAAPTAAAGKPWVWYAPTLKGVSLVQRKRYFDAFMEAGIGVAGCDLGEVRGAPGSTADFTTFYEAMVARGWSARPILLGQSRGGLMLLSWAVRHPEKVAAFVGIYPVLNLASWPLKRSRDATLADFGMSEAELTARLGEFNPIDRLDGLLKHRVPVFVVHGDADVVVPYGENTGLLKERYERGGGRIAVKLIPGEGHQVSPSFFECPELVAFVLAEAEVKASAAPVPAGGDRPAARD